ncbi:hypothetical protein GTR02_06335 [Kineococcus sp. R8]|uniref:hypothetical protein n=1 Tax=Kineococcus siccus TaxID=2696567 RepID=UPI001412044F|nr:hypothetical protein [Kineococcus siccus]
MDLPVVIPLTLLALAVSALGTLVRPRVDTVVVTLLLAAVWSRVNAPVEGEILLTFSADRGFTVADIASVAAVAVAGAGALRLLVRWGRAAAAPSRRRPVSPAASHQGP